MRGKLGATFVAAAVIASVAQMTAQQGSPPGGPPGGPPFGPPRAGGSPPTPRASAAIDLSGTWVSIVNEDWRWRMITAPRGDFPGVPLNPAGRASAMAWDPATDGSCQAFGAAALLRMPTRLRISWADDNTLKIETDNGQQTRLLSFDPRRRPGAQSLQGHSVAVWQRPLPPANAIVNLPGFGRGAPPPAGGSLKVVTTNLRGGWLRRNGIPYGARTTVTEYFGRFSGPDGSEWFSVTTAVVDPEYLLGRFVTSSHFRKEPDGSKWNPRPCKAE